MSQNYARLNGYRVAADADDPPHHPAEIDDEPRSERFAREALARGSPDGLLSATSTVLNVLVYVRDVEGVCPGVVGSTRVGDRRRGRILAVASTGS